MENASKALIMAASVLIALMIIGALLLMFNNIHNYQTSGTQNTREAQIVEFNNQFETYNRKNVRGSDLYSLLNKTIDYNRRETTEGTLTKDKGQYIAYEKLTVTFTIKRNELTADTSVANQLFKANNYTINSNSNTFEKDIKEALKTIEANYSEAALQNLCKATSKIFIKIPASASNEEKKKAMFNAVTAYNSVCKKGQEKTYNSEAELTNSFNSIQGQIKNDVYKYYEYVQFKRALFNCESVKYNKETGRITEMNFKFTGSFD